MVINITAISSDDYNSIPLGVTPGNDAEAVTTLVHGVIVRLNAIIAVVMVIYHVGPDGGFSRGGVAKDTPAWDII